MSFWSSLEAIYRLSHFPCGWQRHTGADFPAFKLLCLEPSGRKADTYPCPRVFGDVHRLIRFPDGTGAIARCVTNPARCPDLTLTLEQISPLRVNQARLGRAIAKALQLTSKEAELNLENTAQIASWSPNAIPVVLTLQCDSLDFQFVVAQLVARLRQKFILLAPTARFLDANCRELLANFEAAFFALETILALNPDGTLSATKPPAEIFAGLSSDSALHSAECGLEGVQRSCPRYALRKGLGVWQLIFDRQEAGLNHERGILYVAWLLYHPPGHPIHALDLIAEVPTIYRQQVGLPPVVDPCTGRMVTLESGARLQERSLALDDAQAMRALWRKERELEAILDSEGASEAEKAEAVRELEEIAEFKRQQGRGSSDSGRRAAHAVRSALARFHEHLQGAVGQDGLPNPVLRAFGEHIHKHILIPSARYAGHGGRYARAGLAGCFTYERPRGVRWSE